MHRYTLSIFILSILLLFSVSSALSAEQFVVSGNPNAPPVVWQENQKLVGFAPDLASSIFNVIGIEHTIQSFGNWQEVQDSAQKGKIDMIASAYKNSDREKYLIFSDAYLEQPTVVVVLKGNEFKFSSWDTLIGKKGVSNIGESYGDTFDQFLNTKLDVSFHPFERAIQLLARNEADYLIADLYTALIYSRLLMEEESISILDPPITTQSFHFAVQKDSQLASSIPEINKKIQDKYKSGEIKNLFLIHFDNWTKRINQKANFFGTDLKNRSAQQEEYLKKQDKIARQRVIRTMTEREGLPKAAQ